MAMTYDSVVQATRKKFLNTDVSSVQGTLAFQIPSILSVKLREFSILKLKMVRFTLSLMNTMTEMQFLP